jgi:hypothetical protein
MYNNLNVVKAISQPKIRRTIEIGTTFIEIYYIRKGLSYAQEGSS